MSELTNEEHKQCCEMAKIMLKVTVPLDTILNTVNVKDQIYGEVSRSFVVRWKDDENFHTVVYNQDLDKPIIVAEWTTLKDFYHLTGDHQDVPNTMYYFLKDKGWTHLHLEDVVECRLVFNHLRKIVKIGAGWKYFCESPSKLA
ncbi:hypothetical protein GmHk_15G044211 [Glycine max]|nr:hypothetical protein GmHk_15G044211 [Glycine max]